jgi:hypothetical protein
MSYCQRICGLCATLSVIVIASFSISLAKPEPLEASQEIEAVGSPCGTTADISNLTVTTVTSMTAVVSWQTNLATESCLDLDSAVRPIFTDTQPISEAFQGVAYAPAEYENYLSWVDRDAVTDTIISDVEAIADANSNSIVLYPAGPTSGGAIHPWDQIVFDTAAARGLKIAFRLEWYPSSFDWRHQDCDAVLNHYDAYLSYFRVNPGRLVYFLINMPLDDPYIPGQNPTIGRQRSYVAYCYSALKAKVPSAQVYANTYYGWRDELSQAAVGDLVDGVSVVAYAQHADGAPFDCTGIPSAGDPMAKLICRDQFDYYLDKAWIENNLAGRGKRLVLDATGFAPASSYADPGQRNGIVADSWAKVRAIETLRRYLAQDPRVYGWSYFELLHKSEAAWGLIDRRRIADTTVTLSHQLTLTNLFPATPYTFTAQAGETTSAPQTFTTPAALPPGDVPPLLTITQPPYDHELVSPMGQLAITWRDDDPDDDATLGLYYDVNDAGCDGTMVTNGISENSLTDSFTWTLPTALPAGSYYIYGQIDDGTNPTECDYSSGRFVPSLVSLKVFPASGVITVDGELNEAAWQKAISLTYAIHLLSDTTSATVRARWDQDYLYLGFVISDTQVETSADDEPWNDDGVSAIFDNGAFKCRQDVGGTGEGVCNHAVYLPSCTTLDFDGDTDCGFTVEMRIQWGNLHATANVDDVIPADFLSVDHDGNPTKPYNDPNTEFSKLSWDGDGSVDTSGRSLTLGMHIVYLPLIRRN